jgi:hypothetical protein
MIVVVVAAVVIVVIVVVLLLLFFGHGGSNVGRSDHIDANPQRKLRQNRPPKRILRGMCPTPRL